MSGKRLLNSLAAVAAAVVIVIPAGSALAMPAIDTTSGQASAARNATTLGRSDAAAESHAALVEAYGKAYAGMGEAFAGRNAATRVRSKMSAERYAAMVEAYGKAYAGMGEAFAGRNATTLERSRVAGAASMVGVGEAYSKAYAARNAAARERSNAANAARGAATAEYYAHGPLMLAKPAIGNGSVTSEIAPTGEQDAGRTLSRERHIPGGGP